MIFYVLLILIATVFAFVEMAYPDNERLKRWTVVLLSFAMIFLAGFRLEVGGDWDAYLSYHDLAGTEKFAEYIQLNDSGYMAIGWILARAGLAVWSINLFCALILTLGIMALSSSLKYRNLFALSSVPYLVIVVGMGYSRQSVAIGVICLAMWFAFRNRWFATFLYSTSSLLFHKSAAFGIMPILLIFGKKRWHTIAIFIVCAPVVVFFVVTEGMEIAQKNYLEAEYNSRGALIRALQIFFCGAWYLTVLRKHENRHRRKLLNILAVLGVLSIPAVIFSPSSTLIDRLILYLLPFQCYVLARTPEAFLRGGNRTLAYITVIIINVAIFTVWMTGADNLTSWLPYKNYLWSEN